MKTIIRGRGISALTAAWILAERGFHTTVVGGATHNGLHVAVNADTVGLLGELFGIRISELTTAYWLNGRIVSGWNVESKTVNTKSLSIYSASLTEAIEQRLRRQFGRLVFWSENELEPDEETFTFQTRANDQAVGKPASSLSFGRRVATMATLTIEASNDVSRFEKTELGWQFLLPTSSTEAKLFVVVANPELSTQDCLDSALRNSSFSSDVRSSKDLQPWLQIAPKIYHPLAGSECIRIGEAAFSLDPVCGDGIGYSVRSALLATKSFVDNCRGDTRGIEYYRARLVRAFRSHLQGCANYYSGWFANGWREELSHTMQGIAFLSPPKTA